MAGKKLRPTRPLPVVTMVAVLATALLFIQRLRSRAVIEAVTYTTENVSGLDVGPGPLQCVDRPRHRRGRGHARTIIQIEFECSSIASRPLARRRTDPADSRCSGHIPQCSRPGGQSGDREAYCCSMRRRIPRRRWRSSSTPDRAYVPSMPTPLAAMRDRVPEVLERAEATLRALAEIVSRIPDSLDRSDKFFTNVERIIQQSDLPALSADSRKFFATTARRSNRSRPSWKRWSALVGRCRRSLTRARAAIKAADLPATNQSAPPRRSRPRSPPMTCGGQAAGDPGFARTVARPRAATPGAARVSGLRSLSPAVKR